jgi:subtilisin family serine protease
MRSSRSRNNRNRSNKPNQNRAQAVRKDDQANMRALLSYERAQSGLVLPNIPDIPRMRLKDKVYTFSRSTNLGQIGTTAASVPSFGAIYLPLSGFPNSSEFTTLFDRYRIVQLQVEFLPVSGPSALVANQYGNLTTVIDLDDSTPPTSEDQLLQYENRQITVYGRLHSRVWTPKFALAAYAGTFTSYASSTPNQWVDVASPDVNYYGLKWSIGPSSATGNQYNVRATAVLQFKEVR